ncbi:MAG: NAD(P)/FAD-dependent oxidoreductase [Actinomycetota bacterium]|nr:MAG: NAD(P)/FAD-dependent oxidoreductase [Actinomycetota bacterium]
MISKKRMIIVDNQFDVLVIGTGASGSNAAYQCKSAGMDVAIIDQAPFGGTCVLRGCDPKKILHGVSEISELAGSLGKVFKGSVKIDWGKLIEFKRTFSEGVPEKREKGFKDNDIAAFKGTAGFTGKNVLSVNDKKLSARFIVIATGSVPRKLSFPGAELLITSDVFMENNKLPGEIIFIGGGYISFELAHISARAGAKVKIIHRSSRPLKQFDQDVVEMMLEATAKAGIEFIPDVEPDLIKRKGKKLFIDCGVQNYTCDMAVHGAGRVPDTRLLDLEKGHIEEDHGVLVNKYFQSVSNPCVYAVGDAASIGQPLTPVVSMQGKIAAYNIINGNKKSMDYSLVPSVVFTTPPMGSVGLTEKQAGQKGLKYRINMADTTRWYNSRRLGFKKTGFKILIDKESDRIIGAHILAPGAEEVIDFFMLAMKTGIKTSEIKDMIFSYPSGTYDIKYMV